MFLLYFIESKGDKGKGKHKDKMKMKMFFLKLYNIYNNLTNSAKFNRT
jgi:hypothetical protein